MLSVEVPVVFTKGLRAKIQLAIDGWQPANLADNQHLATTLLREKELSGNKILKSQTGSLLTASTTKASL